MSEWIKVADKSEIPTDTGKLVQAGGKEIALFQIEGKVYALENHCPHRGGPFAEGGVHGEEVTCPWHGWIFNIKTGCFASNPKIKAETFKVKEESGEVWVEV